MAVRDDRGDVKQTTTGFRGPLMVQSLTSAKSKFLSLIPYSMPHPARLYSKENYQKLYSEVSEIDFSKLTPEESMEKMHSITRLAKSC